MKFITTDDRGQVRRVEAIHIDQVRSWAGRNGFVLSEIKQVTTPGRWDEFEKVVTAEANHDEWRMGL